MVEFYRNNGLEMGVQRHDIQEGQEGHIGRLNGRFIQRIMSVVPSRFLCRR